MMTQQLGFSILSAPLAAIDRRALSQAWYSSLHLEHERPRTVCRDRLIVGVEAESLSLPRRSAPTQRVPIESRPTSNRVRIAKAPNALEPKERRALRSPLARAVERRFLDPRESLPHATFTFGAPETRVRVMLQTTSRGTRVVAFCAPSQRAIVARALEEVRYALAQRGTALFPVVEEVSCK